MKIRQLTVVLIPSVFANPALSCGYCEQAVSFTPELAECYLQRFEEEIIGMEAAALPAQLINLASCDSATSSTRGSGSIPLPGSENQIPTTTFLMDAAGLRCLAKDLTEEDWDPEQFKTFVIKRDCDEQ